MPSAMSRPSEPVEIASTSIVSLVVRPSFMIEPLPNPHVIFIVADADKIRVPKIGPLLEHLPLFPERANISFAQPIHDSRIKLRVWERGVGETAACGTAACATLVALHRRGLVGRKADIELPGGVLNVEWNESTGHVLMTGPVSLSFSGVLRV
jgi:diaminopimelate epimerase